MVCVKEDTRRGLAVQEGSHYVRHNNRHNRHNNEQCYYTQDAFEEVLYQHGVDAVFAGYVVRVSIACVYMIHV